MQRNLWAENQARTYRDEAQRLRAAASRQHDETIACNLAEIATRYEKLAKTLEAWLVTSSAA